MAQTTSKDAEFELRKSVEIFSRDLMLLIKSAHIYPEGHPTVERVSTNLATWPFPGGAPSASIGITRTELIINSKFFGGKRTQATVLAGFLNNRKIKKITINSGATKQEFSMFANLLAMREIENGEPLVEAFPLYGITNIIAEALDISRIHDSMSKRARTSSVDKQARGRKAWQWLQAENASPEDIAAALTSEELWEGAEVEGEDSAGLGYLLSGLGKRLDQGLSHLSEKQKQMVLDRLRKVGGTINAKELAKMMADCPDPAVFQGEGMMAMIGDMEGEALVDIMASVVSAEGSDSPRLTGLYKQLAASVGIESALDSVRMKLKEAGHREFAVEVWETLETLLFSVFEDQFMEDDYKADLEFVVEPPHKPAVFNTGFDYTEDVEQHLDDICLSIAVSSGGILEKPWEDLFARLRWRMETSGFDAVFNFLVQIDEAAPYAIDAQTELIKELVKKAVDNARDMGPHARKMLKKFCVRHQHTLIEFLLNELSWAVRISTRRVLVDLMSGMGPETTPKIISRARRADWYVTRNLVLALGRRLDPQALPFITSVFNHGEARVRRTALRTVPHFGDEGLAALRGFLDSEDAEERDIELARAIWQRLKDKDEPQ